MLSLTRRMGEGVFIGDNVTLIVLGIFNGRAKFGVEAPKDLRISQEREENAIEKREVGTYWAGKGQSVFIGGNITMKVLHFVKNVDNIGREVKIGLDAPREVAIVRSEMTSIRKQHYKRNCDG